MDERHSTEVLVFRIRPTGEDPRLAFAAAILLAVGLVFLVTTTSGRHTAGVLWIGGYLSAVVVAWCVHAIREPDGRSARDLAAALDRLSAETDRLASTTDELPPATPAARFAEAVTGVPTAQQLRARLGELPDRQQLLVMGWYGGLRDTDQLATILGLDAGTAEQELTDALDSIRRERVVIDLRSVEHRSTHRTPLLGS